jgi:2-succinyl-5-enolpyruvyl-6-hydroxy-3-cyclohexene-1-carboxylate synthase
MTPENLLTAFSRLLFESLADAGLRDVVVSPGSRSTPLVWAALSCSRLRCTSIVDERAAGFYAVGRAKITGVPAALVCTSGSAAANYFPAVVEASMARAPLLVLTADRPFELLDCGASQTLDQTRLYGDYVRRFVELGMPEPADAALFAVRRRAAQAIFDATLANNPGPVHVNVRARKPLEPLSPESAEARDLAARVDICLRRPIVHASSEPRAASHEAISSIAHSLSGAARGVIVCGPGSFGSARCGAALARLATAIGFPVYAETTSQLRFDGTGTLAESLVVDGLDLLLRAPRFHDVFRPDIVLQVGQAPTSGAWERNVAAKPDVARHVLTPHGFPDPTSTARTVVVADVESTLERLAESAAMQAPLERQRRWATTLSRASAAAFDAVEKMLGRETRVSEGSATRAVVRALPSGGLLAVGNSLPVRHVDAFCRAAPQAAIGVWSQRGVAGIDGLVSGAAGAATASGRPTALLLGDVSALHDIGGFAVAAETDVPFVVVVLNNGGGRIFEQLPFADSGVSDDIFRFWTTPHATHFDGLARCFRLVHTSVTTPADLDRELQRGLARRGCTIVEVPVPPHGARDQYQEIAVRVDEAVGSFVGALAQP